MTKTIEEKEQQSFVWAATFRIKKANSNEIKHLGYSSDEESGTFIQNWLRRHIRKIENEIILSSTNIPDTIDEWIPIQLSDIHQMIQDMLAFMDSRKEKMQEAIDLHLAALTNPEKIEGAALSQIATSFGIIVDKATRNTASSNDSLHKLDNLLKEFKDAVKPEAD